MNEPAQSDASMNGPAVPRGDLPVCAPLPLLAGACARAADQSDARLTNEGPALEADILAIGESAADTACFGPSNWGSAVPAVLDAQDQPMVPEDVAWWRVRDGEGGLWTVGVAAPGLERLGIAVGDRVRFKHSVSYGGEWEQGTAQIEIVGRGLVELIIGKEVDFDEVPSYSIAEGRHDCVREGYCGGVQWTMQAKIDGQEVSVASGASISIGKTIFTNVYGFTHDASFHEPDEEHARDANCDGPNVDFFAAVVHIE